MLINDFVYQLMNNIFGAENALQLFKIISIIGDTEYSILLLIIIGCILYFLENKSHSKYLILLVLLNASFIKVLKWIINKPRPELALITETTPAFPSGHTAMAMIIFILVLHYREHIKNIYIKSIIICMSLLWLILIIIDRLYLYVHDIYDIFGSIIISIIMYIVANYIWRVYDNKFNKNIL